MSTDGAGLTDELVVELTPAEPEPEPVPVRDPAPDGDLDE